MKHIPKPAGAASRRRFMLRQAAMLLWALPSARRATAHAFGRLRSPLALPADMEAQLDSGRKMPLHAVFAGRISALQLIFTGCSESCLLQGALFAEVGRKLARSPLARAAQLVSISVDPMDTAGSLALWLEKFSRGRQWIGVILAHADLIRLSNALDDGGRSSAAHTSAVFFVDQRGRLVWRSEELPSANAVLATLQALSAQPA